MTGRPVRIQQRAQAHLDEAYEWYERQQPGLGLEFLGSIEACLTQIEENPGMWPVYRDRMRRAIARRFPYLIFYVVQEDASVVLAVFHASRDPRRWP